MSECRICDLSSSIPATPGAPRLLRKGDLAQYTRVPGVALMQGEAERLRAIAEATNARCERGEFPTVLVGLLERGARREADQPEPVGVAAGFRLGSREGRPCLVGDLFIRPERAGDAEPLPRLRVELHKGEVDSVLLVREPSRAPSPAGARRRAREASVTRYARDGAECGPLGGSAVRRAGMGGAWWGGRPPLG